MGTQGHSKIFTKGYMTHYAIFKPVYVQVKLFYKEIQINNVSFVLPFNMRMGMKLKHLVKSKPYLKCLKEVKIVSSSEDMKTHTHTNTHRALTKRVQNTKTRYPSYKTALKKKKRS